MITQWGGGSCKREQCVCNMCCDHSQQWGLASLNTWIKFTSFCSGCLCWNKACVHAHTVHTVQSTFLSEHLWCGVIDDWSVIRFALLSLSLDVTAHYKLLWTDWQLSDFGRHHLELSKYLSITTTLLWPFFLSAQALIMYLLHLSQVQVKNTLLKKTRTDLELQLLYGIHPNQTYNRAIDFVLKVVIIHLTRSLAP